MSDDENDPPQTGDDGAAAAPYEVGYGKPPRAHQFRKGDGRPRGRRPKGTQNIKTLIRQEHARMVRLRGKDGRVKKRPAIAALIQQEVAEAFDNFKVRARQIDLAMRFDAEEEARSSEGRAETLRAEDAAILARYLPAALEAAPAPDASPPCTTPESDEPKP